MMERKALYESWKQSGLTKAKFCKQSNIGRRTFYTWIKQLQNNNHITDDNNNEEVLNIFNDTNTADGGVSLEAESIKFLKVSEISNAPPHPSQKSSSLESSSPGSLEISLPNGAVIKVTVSQNHINTFLQEIIRNGNRSTI